MPHSRITHLPVIPGILYPGFIKTPIKGNLRPSSRITHLSVLGGRLGPDVNIKNNKRDRIPEPDDNNPPPVLEGVLYPDFIEKPIKRTRCPNSRLTVFPVQSGIPYPGIIKTPIKGARRPNSKLTQFPALGGSSRTSR